MKVYSLFILFFCLFEIQICALEREEALISFPHSNHKIEILIEKPSQKVTKLLLFLHGASGGLKNISESTYTPWLEKGYAIAAISMPGYGDSSGRKDFCGSATLSSLNFAIDHIKDSLEVPNLGIIGFGQGGLAAILLSTQRDDIICIVCSNGGYDLVRHKKTNDELMDVLKERYDIDVEDEEVLKQRSPLQLVNLISAPLFLLHRNGNPLISEEEVSDFHQAMLHAEKECILVIKEKKDGDDAQKLSNKEILAETENWIDGLIHLKSPPE